ncbi:hypothetical protein TTRE_0000226401 [Trichuris trichiura]|uniref:Uncharacterized protein n=1 Tax=Trichuris trichiura TaxID=36087 RepID=A0A077Z5N5_TRITR|nr:hypothetical protein TTRE_0000226401 [Trichuris trichiura]
MGGDENLKLKFRKSFESLLASRYFWLVNPNIQLVQVAWNIRQLLITYGIESDIADDAFERLLKVNGKFRALKTSRSFKLNETYAIAWLQVESRAFAQTICAVLEDSIAFDSRSLARGIHKLTNQIACILGQHVSNEFVLSIIEVGSLLATRGFLKHVFANRKSITVRRLVKHVRRLANLNIY